MAKSPRRVRLNPTTVLLAAAMVSAGLVAFLNRGAGLKSKPTARAGSHDQGASSSDEMGHLRSPGSAHEDETSLSEMEVQDLKRRWAEAQKEIEEIDIPTMAEARAMQASPQRSREDIVRDGIDALVPHLRCSLPAVLVDGARSGPGVLGCVLESKEGRTTIVGRAAHRRGSGNFEVGEYQEGLRQGKWEEYYPSGILAVRGEYEDGRRNGAWDEFDEEGIHRVRRHYLAGQKYGAAIHYFQDDPKIELWSSVGRLDPKTKQPMDERLAVVR